MLASDVIRICFSFRLPILRAIINGNLVQCALERVLSHLTGRCIVTHLSCLLLLVEVVREEQLRLLSIEHGTRRSHTRMLAAQLCGRLLLI